MDISNMMDEDEELALEELALAKANFLKLREWMREMDWIHFAQDYPEVEAWFNGFKPKYDPLMREEDGRVYEVMLKIAGKTFRCECGCNVFHHPDKTRLDLYECNACRQWYASE